VTPQSGNLHTVLRGSISRACALTPKRFANWQRRSDPELRQVLRLARENIRKFHERQLETSWEMEAADGGAARAAHPPLQSVGLYVPGGTAAYPSTVLMNAVPAQLAGRTAHCGRDTAAPVSQEPCHSRSSRGVGAR
jgi:histidinol dehydrogenase